MLGNLLIVSAMGILAEGPMKAVPGEHTSSAQSFSPMLDFFALCTEALAALYMARRRQLSVGPVTDDVLNTGKARFSTG